MEPADRAAALNIIHNFGQMPKQVCGVCACVCDCVRVCAYVRTYACVRLYSSIIHVEYRTCGCYRVGLYGAAYSLWDCTLCVSPFLQLFKKPHRPKRVHNVAPPIADFAPSPLARLFYRDIAALEPSKDCTLSRFLGNFPCPVGPGEIPYGLLYSLVVPVCIWPPF